MTQIKQFDIKSLFETKPTIVIIGRRSTGKTVLVCDILDHYTKTPVNGTVITCTDRDFYNKYTQSSFIHDEYKPSIIKNVVKTNQNSFLVLDNCMYDMSWTRDTFMRNIFGNGYIMMILALDFPLGISIKMREKVDYVFLLRENFISNRKHIWEIYGSIFPSFELFCSILDDCTKDNNCLVIKNNCEESCDLFDRIFTYRAEFE